MRKQDKIILTREQRNQLHDLIRKGEHKAQVIRNAQIILKSAEGWTDQTIAQAYAVSKRTVIRVRQHWLKYPNELEQALSHLPRSGAPVQFGPREQALVIAQACTPAPPGYQRWTLALLSEHLTLELEGQPTPISRETVRRILKKTNLSLTEKSSGASPG